MLCHGDMCYFRGVTKNRESCWHVTLISEKKVYPDAGVRTECCMDGGNRE